MTTTHPGQQAAQSGQPPESSGFEEVIPLGEDPSNVWINVKFDFTNQSFIPPGIPQIDRDNDAEWDVFRKRAMAQAGQADRGAIGRLRPLRPDTDNPVHRNIHCVQASFLRRGLANIGYRLVDAHWYWRTPTPSKRPLVVRGRTVEQVRKPKAVVNLTFYYVPRDRPILELPRSATEAFRQLANTSWANYWGYDNRGHYPNIPELRVVTINMGGREPSRKPAHALRIRNWGLCLEPVEALVPEDQE